MEPLLRSATNNSWIFGIVLLVILLLGISRIAFSKYFNTLGDLNLFIENQGKFIPLIIVIHILLACTFGLTLYPFIDLGEHFKDFSEITIGWIIIGSILIYYIFRFIVNIILVYLLDLTEHYRSLLKVKLYYRIYALIGLTITCLFLYYSEFNQTSIFYIGLSIVGLTMILEYIYQLSKNGMRSIYVSYYFILYLCILEILPVLYVLNHWNS